MKEQRNNARVKYLSEKEQIRVKLLEDEIFMLSRKVERVIKKREDLQREVKCIHESTNKI